MTTNAFSRSLRCFQDIARRHGLPPQAADQMMAVLADHTDGVTRRQRAVQARWADLARTDPEFGRNAFPAALHTARKAVERFGGDRLKQALNETGLGSHPEIIRAFWKVGKAMPDPRPAGPQRRPTHEETMRAMYPSMYGNKI
jgi:hypothetical protein